MARKLRVFVEGIPTHIKIQSIDSLIIFKDDEDYDHFLTLAYDLMKEVSLAIHAYTVDRVFFEFLATPQTVETIPKFMQKLSRRYSVYYNKKYQRTGTIWAGRYKSSMVEAESYLFSVMEYIESLNNKGYSSSNKNRLDKEDKIVIYHSLYKQLGYTQKERINKYQDITQSIIKDIYPFIETSLEKQTITGSKKFIDKLEQSLNMVLSEKKRGRPKKEKKEKKKMYKNLQILDKEKHKNLKINPMINLEFAKETAFIPVVISELSNVGGAFPIVFSADENPSLISIVSLGGSGNLAINNEGKWITNYVPSFLRKYPFSLGRTKENPEQKIIMIDEDSSLVSKTQGKELFTENGERTELLIHAIDFLQKNERQVQITSQFSKEIKQSGILEDMEISVGEGEEKKVLVKGFQVISKEKLNDLSDDILASWVRRGIIDAINIQIKSLENINTLFSLASQKQQ